MKLLNALIEKAKKNTKKIILPEGNDLRVIKAASRAVQEKIASIILIGDRETIENVAKGNSIELQGIEIVEPPKDAHLNQIVSTFYEVRKHKGITEEDAKKKVLENPTYFAGLMVRLDMADGFVAGACHTTANVAKAAIHCLKIDKEIGIVSSSFVIALKDCPFGDNGLFIFGDCGIIPNPSAKQLAGVAVSCGSIMQNLFDIEPRIALLSYSTKGSAKGESVEKVLEALKIIKQKAPHLKVDGELQADAAIVPEVAKTKAPKSDLAGSANVLVFPNLDAGNICYKLIQRLGKARVVGPILQGLTKPASDLSRGCGVNEILDAITVTAIRAQQNKKERNRNENTCNKLR